MPVGTAGTVKGVLPRDLAASGAEMILANAYHLMLRPGAERIAALGGLHRLSGWQGPILTDSGGFQVMSLAAACRISDEGALFRSHIDGASVMLTPERAAEVQLLLGSDIAMVLDQCIAQPAERGQALAAMRRSGAWALRSKRAWEEGGGREEEGRALFGIVQGGTERDLRQESAEGLVQAGFSGYAIGGLAVGEGQAAMLQVLEWMTPLLPRKCPRYLMGAGTPLDIVLAVARGIDLFDCVLPTRAGRTGTAFVGAGSLNLRNQAHADDPAPLDPACPCPACTGCGFGGSEGGGSEGGGSEGGGSESEGGGGKNEGGAGFSRAWLHHLVKRGEILGAVLLTLHNLAHYQTLMTRLRRAVETGTLAGFVRDFQALAGQGPRGAPSWPGEPSDPGSGNGDSPAAPPSA